MKKSGLSPDFSHILEPAVACEGPVFHMENVSVSRVRNPLEEVFVFSRPDVIHDSRNHSPMTDTDSHRLLLPVPQFQHVQFILHLQLVESSANPLCETSDALASRRRCLCVQFIRHSVRLKIC